MSDDRPKCAICNAFLAPPFLGNVTSGYCSMKCMILGTAKPTDKPEPAGRKNDDQKPRWDLLPTRAIRAVVDVLSFGAKKYSPGNWRKVPDAKDRYYAALLRHLVAWREGEKLDPESGLHHLGHALCCGIFLLELDQ